jgi:UDP-GlcNAc:undecaprenyl-phosphate GlcNAc-1-phosphate transferase
VRDYLLTVLVTAAVTYLLTPLVRRLAGRIGAIKEPRGRDVHVAPVPLIGGLAMYGGLVAGLLVADQIPQLRDGFANTGMVSGLLLAGGLLVVIGIIDDRWGMSALTKGAGQVAAGGILVATGTQLSWLPEPGGGTFVPTTVQSAVLTVLIVVATINAVNFIDGLDGLAAGIVAIAAISFFLYYYQLTRVIQISSLAAPALASAVLIGMCLGFLPHNFSPASIFMGDTGAMLLGLLLAYAPISSITSLDPAVLTSRINRYPEIMPMLLPAALLVIPYGDLLLAVVRRTRAGRSPFAPDRKHLHHRLLDIGHSQRASVLIMYLWAAVFSGTVVWLSIEKTKQPSAANHHGEPVLVFVGITVAAVAALLLMSMPRLRWWGRQARSDGQAAAPTEAPLPSPASAEQQLVGAAAVSRTAQLAAPVIVAVPENGSAVAENAAVQRNGAAVPENGAAVQRNGAAVPENGPAVQRNGAAVPENGAAVRRGGSPARPDPGPPDWAASGRPASDSGNPDWQPAERPPAERPPAERVAAEPMWRKPEPVRRDESPLDDARPGGSGSGGWWSDGGRSDGWWSDGRHVAGRHADGRQSEGRRTDDAPSAASRVGNARPASPRSIIGTPPPAVSSLDSSSSPPAEAISSERGDLGSPRS